MLEEKRRIIRKNKFLLKKVVDIYNAVVYHCKSREQQTTYFWW